MAIYPYIVNLNGTWYPAGTVVPDSHSEKEVAKETVEEVAQPVIKETVRRNRKKRTVNEE